MTADASSARYQSHGQRDRAQAILATLLVHAALLAALLMSRPDVVATIADRRLNIFDVAQPPPPPPEPSPPPPQRVQPIPDRIQPTNAGGAPRRSPAPPTPVVLVPSVIEAPEVTLVPDTIALPLPDSGSTADDGSGTAAAAGLGGAGQGSGEGQGDGDARGGGGKRDRYHRAAWIYHPTEREMGAYWPETAKRKRISGTAVLSCTLQPSGQPKRCVTLGEFPKDAGFGDAAIRMAPTFRIRHVMRNKQPLDIPVIVPIEFDYRRL